MMRVKLNIGGRGPWNPHVSFDSSHRIGGCTARQGWKRREIAPTPLAAPWKPRLSCPKSIGEPATNLCEPYGFRLHDEPEPRRPGNDLLVDRMPLRFGRG